MFGFGPLALLMVNLRAAAFVTMLGGVWLVVSPWMLGYATDHAAWLNELVTGVLLIVLCADAAGFPVFGRVRARLTGRKSATPAIANTAGARS